MAEQSKQTDAFDLMLLEMSKYVISTLTAITSAIALGTMMKLRIAHHESIIANVGYSFPKTTVVAYNAVLVASALVAYETTIQWLGGDQAIDAFTPANSTIAAFAISNLLLDIVAVPAPFTGAVGDHFVAYSAAAGALTAACYYASDFLQSELEILDSDDIG